MGIIIYVPDIDVSKMAMIFSFFSTISTALSGAMGYIIKGMQDDNNKKRSK